MKAVTFSEYGGAEVLEVTDAARATSPRSSSSRAIPARVATVADFSAARLGVKVSGGGDGRHIEALDEAAVLVRQGRLRVTVAGTFGFGAAAEAHRRSEAGRTRGKLVLRPD